MPKFTVKQEKFIALKRQGYSNEKAAIGAGYAPGSAKNQATLMLRNPKIARACKITPLNKAERSQMQVAVHGKAEVKNSGMPKSKYSDPKDFLRDLMNNENVPLMMRKDAAKDLMPYMHARIGEKGKKEEAHDAAKKTHARFTPTAAPSNITPIRKRA